MKRRDSSELDERIANPIEIKGETHTHREEEKTLTRK